MKVLIALLLVTFVLGGWQAHRQRRISPLVVVLIATVSAMALMTHRFV
jgi:hypothetical protein